MVNHESRMLIDGKLVDSETGRQFDNINIFVQRDLDKKYIRSGRLQDETQARAIDSQMRTLLANDGIRYKLLAPDHRAIIEYAATLE